MSRSIDRRTFLKGVAVLAAAAPASALAGGDARAADPPVSIAGTPPPPPPGPDFSICRTPEERTMLETQYASALDLVKTIREAPLLPDVPPVTAFAALPRMVSVDVPPPVPAPGTPRRPEEK